MSEIVSMIENHRKGVAKWMFVLGEFLQALGRKHDLSKYDDDEWSVFEKYTPLLPTMEYGSEEYKKSLEKMRPGLEKHYMKNSHHPEHFVDGIEGMNLFQMLEMLVDWYVASKGKIDIKKQQERFRGEEKLWLLLERSITASFDVGKQLVMQVLEEETDQEVRKIVWDWFVSISVDSSSYPKPDKDKFEKAKSYIFILCGNGLG